MSHLPFIASIAKGNDTLSVSMAAFQKKKMPMILQVGAEFNRQPPAIYW